MTNQPSNEAPIGFAVWSRRLAPGMDLITDSNPDAVLADDNIVAVTDDADRARDVARAFEGLAGPTSAITTVVYGDATRQDTEHTADPDRVVADAGRKALSGAIIGAILGAVIVGLGSWLVTDSGTAALAGAVGGALFGAAVIGVWMFVIRSGQSEAYMETFVDPVTADVTVVALHAGQTDEIDQAVSSLSGKEGVRLMRVNRGGESADGSAQPTNRS